MGQQVDPGDRGEPAESVRYARNVEPGLQESRGLSTLTGAGDGEHEDKTASSGPGMETLSSTNLGPKT